MAGSVTAPDAWRALIERLEASAQPQTSVTVVVRSRRHPRPPAEVIDAFERAGREAIRNAGRHGGVSTVEVQLVLDAETATLRIQDHGVGFDVERRPRSNGLHHSIVAPLERVGGAATIRSQPGVGTEVELSWSAKRGVAAQLQSNYEDVAVLGRRVAAGVIGPMVAGNTALAVWQQTTAPAGAPMWLVLLGIWLAVGRSRITGAGDER